MSESLTDILRQHLVDAYLDNARTTRDYPDVEQRSSEARRQVRMILYEFALGRITLDERQQILDLLQPCCPDLFEAAQEMLPPPPELRGLDDPFGAF